MFYLTLIIPAALSIVMLLFFSRKVNLYEHGLLWAVSIISYLIVSNVMISSNVSDTEYLSSLTVKTRYYEDWNEYIHKTCSRQSCSGSGNNRVCHTIYYDCSYVKYHPERWTITDQFGSEIDISQSEYNRLGKLWKTPSLFIEMDRNYHTNDGDAYEYHWNRKEETARLIARSNNYDNPTQAANSLFRFKDVTPEEATKLGLFEYPDINNYYQKSILGLNFPEHTRNKIDYLNATLGKQKQVKVFFLYFWDKPVQVAFDQKNYWKGGNKNEIIICVGVDKASHRVQWVEAFSWAKNPIVEVKIKGWYADNPSFNLNKLQPELKQWIIKDWKRREFHDFDYITLELTYAQTVWLWIIISLMNIGVAAFVIFNEHDNEHFEINLFR